MYFACAGTGMWTRRERRPLSDWMRQKRAPGAQSWQHFAFDAPLHIQALFDLGDTCCSMLACNLWPPGCQRSYLTCIYGALW